MSYSKNSWETGDIITSEKLNHMEEGISNSDNSPVDIQIQNQKNADTGKDMVVFSATAEQLYNIVASGKSIHLMNDDTDFTVDVYVPVEIFRFCSDGTYTYMIKARCDHESNDVLFYAGGLSGNDTVVLTEV